MSRASAGAAALAEPATEAPVMPPESASFAERIAYYRARYNAELDPVLKGALEQILFPLEKAAQDAAQNQQRLDQLAFDQQQKAERERKCRAAWAAMSPVARGLIRAVGVVADAERAARDEGRELRPSWIVRHIAEAVGTAENATDPGDPPKWWFAAAEGPA